MSRIRSSLAVSAASAIAPAVAGPASAPAHVMRDTARAGTGGKALVGGARVIAPDVAASNGVIHVINRVLISR